MALLTLLLIMAPAPSVAARGDWIALDRGTHCSAETPALRPPARGREPGRLVLRFGPDGAMLLVRLARVPAAGDRMTLILAGQPFALPRRGDLAATRDPVQLAAMIEALRAGGWASARVPGPGGRSVMVDHYRLTGAPLAIDAAAACFANKRR